MAKNIAQLMVDTLVQAGAKRSAFPKTHSLVRTEDSRQIKATLARASQIALRAPLRGLHRGVAIKRDTILP
jgi:hypothetical protein